MNKKATLRALVVLTLGSAALVALPAHAEDIDIYGAPNLGDSSNLVIILDNASAANANSVFRSSTARSSIRRTTSFGSTIRRSILASSNAVCTARWSAWGKRLQRRRLQTRPLTGFR